ncbi:MAG TPA: adenylate/guanylate cyclase domain-containing protein [Candidatus Competibacteraceae bacterium]|nr:adenylate/guanylate cyclase domain-containing protein [Candidatus Competibacteraceae bacterium]
MKWVVTLFRQESSLSRRLHRRVILLGFIAVVGLVIAIVVGLLGTLDRLERQLRETGIMAVHAFDFHLLEVKSDLIATGEALSEADDPGAVLRHLIARRPTLFELLLIDSQGRVLVQRHRVGRPDLTEVAKQPWLDTVRAGELYLGPVDFGEFSVPTVNLAVPVADKLGVFAATLVARFDLTTLWNIAIGLRVGETGYVYITDQVGQLVAYRNLRFLHSGITMEKRVGATPWAIADGGLHVYTGLGGAPVIALGMPFELAPWFAIVEQPLVEALGPFVLRSLGLLAALVLAGLLVNSIAHFTRHKILFPLRLLQQGVEQLQAGDLSARTELPPGYGELSQLAGAFDQMAARLQEREEQLRQSLAEVTALKNLLDNIFASIVSGVITTDLHGRITLCNLAALHILGYRQAAELVGQNMAELFPPLGETLLPHFFKVCQTDKPVIGLEVSPTLPQRGPVHLRFNLSALRGFNQLQGVAIVLDDVTDMRRMEAQRRLLEHMVSPVILNQIDPERLALGGKRMEITTLFADIHGFTSISEQLSPEDLVGLLNRYLAAMANAVLAEEGSIDKFLGDAVMAWFNAPLPQSDHVLRAVRAALGIRDAIHALHQELSPIFRLSLGVGIHVGEAVLGLIGSEERMEYTAIGDDVNIAKRIQEYTGLDQILISAAVYARVQEHISVRPGTVIQVKGKQKPLEVYEVLGLK